MHFAKTERACRRNPGIVLGHWFPVNRRRQQIDPRAERAGAAQIADEHRAARKFAAPPQGFDGIVIAEMVQGKREQNDVVRFGWVPFQQVAIYKSYLRITDIEPARDFDCARLLIDWIDLYLDVPGARPFDHHTWNITGARG